LGRYINDAPRRKANCVAKSAFLADKPRVLIFALTNIEMNSEIRYDYDGNDMPWRKVGTFVCEIDSLLVLTYIKHHLFHTVRSDFVKAS